MENIIVIGGGLMGSSTAWELSQYGEKVVLLEQQNTEYRGGSSFGASRISRSLGSKNDIFSFVQQKTIEEVEKLLLFLNGIEPRKQHKMRDIYQTSPVTYIYNKNQAEELKKVLYKKQKDKYKKAAGDAAFRKFGMTVADEHLVVREYKKHSGTLNPKALIAKLHLGIKKKDNKIRYNCKAMRVDRKDKHYEIKVIHTKTGKKQTLKARKVVIAAGPYTASLLRKIAPYFKKLITPKRVALSFFKISKERFKRMTAWQKKELLKAHPVFDQNGYQYFAMLDKVDKNGNPTFKVGGHQMRGNIPDLEAVWKDDPPKKELKWAKRQFKKYLETLEIRVKKKEIKCIKSYNCVYSVSKTKVPYITNVLTKEDTLDKGIVIVGGMSGIGAKGCLAYGLLAADLLLGIEESSKIYRKARKKLHRPLSRIKKRQRKFI